MKKVIRLEFEFIFPEEEKKNIIEYLKCVSFNTIINIIGFSNTYPQPNFDNFFTNPTIGQDIYNRVETYSKKYQIKEKPKLISRETSLRLAEIILSNKELLQSPENETIDIDTDELNLFKAYLILNKEVNSKGKSTNSTQPINVLVDMLITTFFSSAEIGNFENTGIELLKLTYSTIVRFDLLIDFINSTDEYSYLGDDLCKYFQTENLDDLSLQVEYLFAQLLQIKSLNRFKFKVDDRMSIQFLNTLVSSKITEDDDFTNIKNHPLYKISDNVYSVIDFFFVVDKFIKSVKFILKSSYEKKHNLSSKDRGFFNFYNTKFSEDYLMKHILDEIFHKNHFKKKEIKETLKNEPDYYIRHNNRIYLFENKDVLIAKKTKSSGDIEKINNALKSKFLETNGKPIGIGQLVNSIVSIIENKFKYDDFVNTKKNFTIYPILIVSDRIFEILGVNYRLNEWYLSLIKEKLGQKYNSNFIKNLVIIDIDTLIFWLPHLEQKDNNFKIIIDRHLKEMQIKIKVSNTNNTQRALEKKLGAKMSPISNRFKDYSFPMHRFTEKFTQIINKS